MAYNPDEPLDFPQLWQKPSFDILMSCLESLRVVPRVWNFKTPRVEIFRNEAAKEQVRRQVSGYLSSIIKSDLGWIEDEDQREEIWAVASKRISERCGRTGMGEITRQWPFSQPAYPPFELIIREPPLTGDNLGFKTWCSSYLLAQELIALSEGPLSHIIPSQSSPSRSTGPRLPTVLELGSGTGLLGLAAAGIWGVHVVLTDLPDILPNLKFNADANRGAVKALGGSVSEGALTWGSDEEDVDERFREKHQFQLILAADVLYDDEHPALLASAIDDQLALNVNARALVMIPQRNKAIPELTRSLIETLAAVERPIVLDKDGGIEGRDDWGAWDDNEGSEDAIFCYWGIFRRDLS